MEDSIFSYDDENAVQFFKEYKRSSGYELTYDITLDHFGELKNLSVVDFGCGEGAFLRRCITKSASFCVGFDCSEPMIYSAISAKEKHRQHQSHFVVQDCFEPFSQVNGQFNFAVCHSVVNYCSNEEKLKILFTNIFQSLLKNGKILLSHPPMAATVKDQEAFAEASGLLVPLRNERHGEEPFLGESYMLQGDGTQKPVILCYWSQKKLMQVFEEVGFINVELIRPTWSDYYSDDLLARKLATMEEPFIAIIAEKPD